IDGFNGTCSSTCVGPGTSEVDLDMQLAAAEAPGLAEILVYDGPNSQQGAIDIFDRMASDNSAQVISTSWTESELNAGSALLQAENQIFQRMALQGQTVFSASGDGGAYLPGLSQAQDPASQPYVTGVGGTTLSGTL